MWSRYVQGKQTYEQLAKQQGVTKQTIQNRLDATDPPMKRNNMQPQRTVIIMDTTYFKKQFGVMVWRDAYRKKNIKRMYVKREKISQYKDGIKTLQDKGWEIIGIVCDGRRGLLTGFSDIPVQMCHFHQVAIIRRYITNNPRLEAGKELKEIVATLKETDKTSFEGRLIEWYEKWGEFLKEKTVDKETGRWHYTHRRLRSAYFSLKRNLPNLFTFEDYYERNIPTTTNSLDGSFTNIKNKLRNHPGLAQKRKIKFIEALIFD